MTDFEMTAPGALVVAPAELNMTRAQSPNSDRVGRAKEGLDAGEKVTDHRDLIDNIRLQYRLAKAAETQLIALDHRLRSYVLVFLTAWRPDDEEQNREKARKQAQRVIDTIRKDEDPAPDDVYLCAAAAQMVINMEPTREALLKEIAERHKAAATAVKTLPGWERIKHVKGFGRWGFAAMIGEAGDIGLYSGCRKLYKRFGLAPNECYEQGENGGGRKIPRSTRGRIVGIIAEPLLRAQWRGEKEGVEAHAIGPYGRVYGETKARHLAAGRKKGHAHALARRAMVKALIHDVHRAWHGLPLDYAQIDCVTGLSTMAESAALR